MNLGDYLIDLTRSGYDVHLHQPWDSMLTVKVSKLEDGNIHSIARVQPVTTPDEHWIYELRRACSELETEVQWQRRS